MLNKEICGRCGSSQHTQAECPDAPQEKTIVKELRLTEAVFAALNNALANGFPVQSLDPRDVAQDLIQEDKELERYVPEELLLAVKQWQRLFRDVDMMLRIGSKQESLFDYLCRTDEKFRALHQRLGVLSYEIEGPKNIDDWAFLTIRVNWGTSEDEQPKRDDVLLLDIRDGSIRSGANMHNPKPKPQEKTRVYHGWIVLEQEKGMKPRFRCQPKGQMATIGTFQYPANAIDFWDDKIGKPVMLQETPLGAYRVYTEE